ncbi:Renalase protein [Dioscorea alata]|uniref:Renalase protein n=1 Tax=Dioscorea alata TaxID=55571 RepID=A0ACB7VM73_DIOAL|nr:Renalase protein [Dioscorea alata]
MTLALLSSALTSKPSNPFFSRNPCPPRSSIPLPFIFADVKPSKKQSMDGRTSAPRGKNSNTKKRSSYGTSRRSIIKKSFSQEQVVFTSPVVSDPVVGIIGGGIAGLVCAATLEERGIRSTVFDTGMHGLGGRMATRLIECEQQLVFDHAAQFFTVSDSKFQKLVERWLSQGLVREWKGLVGELEVGGHFKPIPSSSPRYVGVNGMKHLADSILCQKTMVNIVRPCWISQLDPFNGRWHLSEKGKLHGQFDAIVIAHNGKCANRLLSSSGLPLLTKQMKRLELSAIWALLAAFKDPLPISCNGTSSAFEGAFVKGIDSVSWMANNASKLFPSHNGLPQCWTFFSTAAYGKQNKVPQESIPAITAEKVKKDMLGGVETALGLTKGTFPLPFYTRVQLWGAALPTNTPATPFIFDPQGRGGICGDWLLGSSVESAALSGMGLANHIADYFQSEGAHSDEFAVGLQDAFRLVPGHDIGQFPGTNYGEQICKSPIAVAG